MTAADLIKVKEKKAPKPSAALLKELRAVFAHNDSLSRYDSTRVGRAAVIELCRSHGLRLGGTRSLDALCQSLGRHSFSVCGKED